VRDGRLLRADGQADGGRAGLFVNNLNDDPGEAAGTCTLTQSEQEDRTITVDIRGQLLI